MSEGRRRRIPDRIKLLAALRKMGLTVEQVQFDHDPALELRPINPVTGDTVPPANDPDHITMLLIKEHKTKTFGPGGEKRITTAGSDVHKIHKLARLSAEHEDFQRRVLSREPRDGTKPKSRWPKRPMGNGRKKARDI
ncbi:hypothetical protein [Aquibium microcysteis]|uniref:hypothetical protein n=1 Tax=Aquibium microcysteis TaxID=675281 RepID=UPI001EF30031|nr:hypothetical protein [Aquibium microcysteis]